jgi:hypothetical protein
VKVNCWNQMELLLCCRVLQRKMIHMFYLQILLQVKNNSCFNMEISEHHGKLVNNYLQDCSFENFDSTRTIHTHLSRLYTKCFGFPPSVIWHSTRSTTLCSFRFESILRQPKCRSKLLIVSLFLPMDSELHSHQRPSVDSSNSHYSKAAGKHEWPHFSNFHFD